MFYCDFNAVWQPEDAEMTATHAFAAPQPDEISFAVVQHEAAYTAWASATSAADIAAARALSRAAVIAAAIDADWLEELDAACIDTEAEHAAELHAQAIAIIRAKNAPTAPRRIAR
jgi:hypothetical protein